MRACHISPLAISLLAILTSCEKEIEFHYHDIQPQLVIEGNITQTATHVTLSPTTPMDEPFTEVRLTDAAVTVTDITQGNVIGLQPDADGIYASPTPGIPGHSYRLDVTREGHTYSATCTMPHAIELLALEFQWIKMPYDHVAVLQVTFSDPPSAGDHYWVRLTRNGQAYMWSVIDDSASVNGIIDEVIMTSRKDTDEEDAKDVLFDGDVVGVTVAPISREMADYLHALSTSSNGPRMFTGPFCLGYFLTAPVASSSITFHPTEIPGFK